MGNGIGNAFEIQLYRSRGGLDRYATILNAFTALAGKFRADMVNHLNQQQTLRQLFATAFFRVWFLISMVSLPSIGSTGSVGVNNYN